MATNGKPGDNRQHGAVKDRSQAFNHRTEQWIKRAASAGKFMDVKQDGILFKEVRKENL